MKPGILTTEFWVTAGVQIIGILALFGAFTPDQATILSNDLPQMGALVNTVITNVLAFSAMVVSAYKYITGRSEVKKSLGRG